IQPALQLRTVIAQALQHRTSRRERERMTHKGAGEESNADLGRGFVAEIPRSAIERVEEARLAGYDSDRQTAAEHLAVGGQVSLHAKHGLHPARMHAETRYNLVEHQCGAG